MSRSDVLVLLPALARAAAGELTDADLLQRYRTTRDAAAFEVLVWRYGPMVLGTICQRILRHKQDSEDAFQATFLILARKASSIANGLTVGCWLHQVARRVALRACTMREKQALREDMLPDVLAAPEMMEDERGELLQALEEAMQELPRSLRQSLVLRYLAGLSNQQVASRLGCPENTVCSRLARGREQLRRKLEKRDLRLPAIGLTLALETVAAASEPSSTLTFSAARLPFSTAWHGSQSACAGSRILSLSEGVLRMLFWNKFRKTLVATFVCTFAVLTLMGVVAYRELRADPVARAVKDVKPDENGGWRLRETLLEKNSEQAIAVALSPDGKMLATAGRDNTVKLWDVAAGKELKTLLKGHPDAVEALAFSPDGKRLAAGCGSIVILWDVPAGTRFKIVRTPIEGNNRTGNVPRDVITSLKFSADGKVLAIGRDAQSNWAHFAVLTGKEREIHPFASEDFHAVYHEGPFLVKAVACCPKSEMVAVAGEVPREVRDRGGFNHISLLDGSAFARAEGDALPDHDETIECVVFSPSGKLLAAGSLDKVVLVYDVEKRKLRMKLKGHEGAVRALAITAQGKLMASASEDRTVRIWDLDSAKEVAILKGHKHPVLHLQFSARDQKLTTVDAQGVVKVWEMK